MATYRCKFYDNNPSNDRETTFEAKTPAEAKKKADEFAESSNWGTTWKKYRNFNEWKKYKGDGRNEPIPRVYLQIIKED